MDIVLMGVPGAGKGTQAAKLENALHCKHISTGDVLRAEIASGSPLGKQIAGIIDGGDLIPDEMMVSILKNAATGTDKGIIFDGFPRTVAQAEMLNNMLGQLGRKLVKAVMIDLSEEAAVKRLCARRQCHLPDGSVHQIGPDFSPEDCRAQGGSLFTRPDDTPEHIRHRLSVYHQQTQPVADFYKTQGIYAQVDGDKDPQQVFAELLAVLQA